jgi:hypothetical protein
MNSVVNLGQSIARRCADNGLFAIRKTALTKPEHIRQIFRP